MIIGLITSSQSHQKNQYQCINKSRTNFWTLCSGRVYLSISEKDAFSKMYIHVYAEKGVKKHSAKTRQDIYKWIGGSKFINQQSWTWRRLFKMASLLKSFSMEGMTSLILRIESSWTLRMLGEFQSGYHCTPCKVLFKCIFLEWLSNLGKQEQKVVLLAKNDKLIKKINIKYWST